MALAASTSLAMGDGGVRERGAGGVRGRDARSNSRGGFSLLAAIPVLRPARSNSRGGVALLAATWPRSQSPPRSQAGDLDGTLVLRRASACPWRLAIWTTGRSNSGIPAWCVVPAFAYN